MKTEVLFICKGNVGRSQMAEGFYNSFQGQTKARSAGIDNVRRKYRGRPTPEIVQVMQEEGIDVSQQRIKQVKIRMLRHAGEIVVLCRENEVPSYLLKRFGSKMTFAFVEDPFEMGIEGTRLVRNKVKEIVLGVMKPNVFAQTDRHGRIQSI